MPQFGACTFNTAGDRSPLSHNASEAGVDVEEPIQCLGPGTGSTAYVQDSRNSFHVAFEQRLHPRIKDLHFSRDLPEHSQRDDRRSGHLQMAGANA